MITNLTSNPILEHLGSDTYSTLGGKTLVALNPHHIIYYDNVAHVIIQDITKTLELHKMPIKSSFTWEDVFSIHTNILSITFNNDELILVRRAIKSGDIIAQTTLTLTNYTPELLEKEILSLCDTTT